PAEHARDGAPRGNGNPQEDSPMLRPCLQLAALAALALSAAAQSPCCDPWTDLGQALAGAAGAPNLDATGSLADGTQLVLDLDGAAASAPSWLVAGLTELSAPFKG